MLRTVTEDIHYDDNLKQYFMNYCGDDLLLEDCKTDEEAIEAGKALLADIKSKE